MRASPLLQTPSPPRVLYMAVLSGANSYIMADGNVNEFGISSSQRLNPERNLVRDKGEKGWISQPDLASSFSDFSLPQ
jgi:hypothetical protein